MASVDVGGQQADIPKRIDVEPQRKIFDSHLLENITKKQTTILLHVRYSLVCSKHYKKTYMSLPKVYPSKEGDFF